MSELKIMTVLLELYVQLMMFIEDYVTIMRSIRLSAVFLDWFQEP